MAIQDLRFTYQYQLYPTDAQARRLRGMLFHSKRLYNVALLHRNWLYEVKKESISWQMLSRIYVTEGRKIDNGFGSLPYDTATYVLQRMDKAFQAFFKRVKNGVEKAGYPKRMGFCQTLEYKYPCGIKLDAIDVDRKKKHIRGHNHKNAWAKLYLMNVGDVRVRYHRPLPDVGRISYASVTVDNEGKWWVQIVVKIEQLRPDNDNPAVGVDVGLVYALALSDGYVYEPPKFYKAQLRELRILNRKLARQLRSNPANLKEDGEMVKYPKLSNRAKETKQRIRRLHRKVARQRKNWAHVVSDDITKRYGIIVLEDLPIDFMLKNPNLALATHDVSLSMLREMIEYKANERGVTIIKVPPAYTSQTCSACGHVSKENRRTQANFTCVNCGHVENADINAAKNILNLGLPDVA